MIEKKLRSFRFALKGLHIAVREEFNFRAHLVLGLLTIALGAFTKISTTEWLFVLGISALVYSAELFNTALEELCDMLKPTHDPHVAKIKDLSAAAVFVASFFAFITGVVIFLPKLLLLV